MKNYNYMTMVLVTAIICVAVIAGTGNLTKQQEAVTTTGTVNAAEVDYEMIGDACLDSVITVYVDEYIPGTEYELSLDNRANIRTMIVNLGTYNVVKLNEAIYSGDQDTAVEGVIEFIETTFGWEEHQLMKKYIQE